MDFDKSILTVVIVCAAIIGGYFLVALLGKNKINTNHRFTQEELDRINDLHSAGKLQSTYTHSADRSYIFDMLAKRRSNIWVIYLMLPIPILIFGCKWIVSIIYENDEWIVCSSMVIVFSLILAAFIFENCRYMKRLRNTGFKSKVVAVKYTYESSSKSHGYKRTSVAEVQENGTILYYIFAENLNPNGENHWDQVMLADLYRYDDQKSDIISTIARENSL